MLKNIREEENFNNFYIVIELVLKLFVDIGNWLK